MLAKGILLLQLLLTTTRNTFSYAPEAPFHCSRRQAVASVLTGAGLCTLLPILPSQAAHASGSGSSAYAGRTPKSREELRKSYQLRVIADVRDFVKLGHSISNENNLDTSSDPFAFFFNPFQRRQADSLGRTYAGMADLTGHQAESGRALEGGVAYLLAATFAKQGKPPDNVPAVKTSKRLTQACFEPIFVAAKKGDLEKAKSAHASASAVLSEYLSPVDLPGELSDAVYTS